MAQQPLDVAILGAGPAGLSAAIYAGRAGLRCTAFSSGPVGGALQEISHIANYPGFSGSGAALAETMKKQALESGAAIEYGQCAAVYRDDGDTGWVLEIDEEKVQARAVLVATGSAPRQLGFTPKPPVSYCALCDGDLVRGKHIAVVGGGNAAAQEGLYLAGLAAKVTLISHSALKADAALREQLAETSNLEVVEGIEPTAELLDQYDQIFVYIGKTPASDCLAHLGTEVLDADAYVQTGAGELAHETAATGIFAAGDVRKGVLRQAITAAGDGAAAAVDIIDFLQNQQG